MTGPDNLRGALFMCVSMFAFTLNDSLMKSVTQTLPLFQAIAIRGSMTLVGLLILARVTGGLRLWPPLASDRRRVLLRSAADVMATILFLLALRRMPLANMGAILQVAPLAMTLGAALFFRESIGWRRATAIVAGFAGVLLIIRPGADGFDIWSLLGLASVAFVVARDLLTRGLSRDIGAITVALWTCALVTAMGYLVSLVDGWSMPDGVTLAKLALAAGALTVGYMFSVMTMRVGDVGFVAPFRYTSLIWAIVLGWAAFGTLPDGLTVIGAAIVVASGLYTLWREQWLRDR